MPQGAPMDTTEAGAISPHPILLLMLALLMLLAPVSALAEDEPGEPQRGSSHMSSEEALHADAATIAEARGWDEDEALARLERQPEFGELTGELYTDYPETYGGAWTDTDTADGTMHVRFVDEVPQGARDAAEDRGLAVAFHGQADNSRRQLAERTRKLQAELSQRGYPSSAAAYSVRDQQIQAVATRYRDDRSDEQRRNELPDQARRPDVTVEFTDDPVGGPDHTYGGGSLIYYWAGSLRCTTGFTHKDKTGGTGVMSAGHCEDETINFYEQEDGVTYDVSPGGVHRGDYGDFMGWHTAHVDLPEFYSSGGYRRDVEDVRLWWWINQGDVYCKYGRTTGYSCDVVHDPTVWAEWGGYRYENLVAMSNRQADDRDSGGPWFRHNTAAGIHSGWVDLDDGFGARDTWSKADFISYIWDEQGVELQTK